MRSVFGDIHIRATLRFGVGYFLSHSWRRLWRAFFNPSRQVAINDIARVYCRTSGRHEIGRGLVFRSPMKSLEPSSTHRECLRNLLRSCRLRPCPIFLLMVDDVLWYTIQPGMGPHRNRLDR